ncbi:MAG: hypothetical protein JO265_10060, partial [Acidimicrobiia bacterium]|nr:hypothetical protein [Acidimicrobiia bacterium]
MTAVGHLAQRSPMARQAALWRRGGFGRASEEPYRRRVTDWIRLIVCGGVLTGLVLHSEYPSAVERDAFHLFNDLPGAWAPLFHAVYVAGTLWAVGLAAVAALIGRRWRLARDLGVAGFAAWVIARVLGAWVAGEGLSGGFKAVTRISWESPAFPVARVAIVVAIIATAEPYLTRPTRRIGWALVAAAGAASLYLGTGLPDDVVGGIVLGFGVAAAVHLIFGSPGGRPTSAQVTIALAELGIEATGIRLGREQRPGSTLMTGSWADAPIFLRVIGRDENDAQLMAKLWRFLSYKDAGPKPYVSRLQQVEHEAYVTLLASQAGVHTGEVIVAAEAGPGVALLVERPPPGRVLADLRRGDVTDSLLVAMWRHVDRLHTCAHVAHGALDSHHVVVDGDRPAIVDFSRSAIISPGRASEDVVSLLMSTAAAVGGERAVTAAAEGIGTETLAEALP